MKRQKAGFEARVYSYGARAPDPESLALIDAQMQRAHRYYNTLIEIERERRALVREVLGETRWVDATEDQMLYLAEVDGYTNARTTEERARNGVDCWGAYLLAEAAADQARKTPNEPHFRRWDGTGTVAVQLQKGLTVADLLAGKHTFARLSLDFSARGPKGLPFGDGRPRAILSIRVGSAGRAPIWASIEVIWHRSLPESARIKWIRLHRRRVGVHWKWSVQFVLEGLAGWARSTRVSTRGMIAIDVGWRKMANGDMRVATWVDDAGGVGALRVPARLLERWAKVHDLRSIRDRAFNAERDALRAWLADTPTVPEWLRKTASHLHAWRSTARLASLALRWRISRFNGDDGIFERLEAWRRRDKHLLSWECFQRKNVLRARREIYRVFAAHRIQLYRRVVVERLDLRDFAELPNRDVGDAPDDYATANSRGRRFLAAQSELLGAIAAASQKVGAEFIETVAEWTTQHCHDCGTREPFDAAVEVMHVCSTCGVEWDQDVNAARNLLRAVQRGDHPADRSRGEVANAREESPGRRSVGLAEVCVGRRRSQRVV